MYELRSEGMETIDELVTEKRQELDEIYTSHQVDDVCRCPMCIAMENQERRENNMVAFEEMKRVLSTRPVYVFVDLSGVRRVGKVVKLNQKTTWVKVMSGAKTSDYIQRHNEKHNVTPYRLGNMYLTFDSVAHHIKIIQAEQEVPINETTNTKTGEQIQVD